MLIFARFERNSTDFLTHPTLSVMKKLFLFIAFLFGASAVAQNYQNICTSGITFYKNKSNKILALRTDSIKPLASGDTVFISYNAIRDSLSGFCLDTTNGSVLGRKVIKTHDGWFYFFNYRKDTLRIKSNAIMNETWQFASLPDNGYLQAKVTGSNVNFIITGMDSVRIITLQAFNSVNSPIPHPLNLSTIKLSRSYGLSRTPDMYYVPMGDTTEWSIAGKTTPAIGVEETSWRNIFTFSVGSIFNYKGEDTRGGIDKKWDKISTVLSRTLYGNDSVKYTFEVCTDTTWGSPLVNSDYFDTISQTIVFAQEFEPDFINALPDQLIRIGNYSNWYYRHMGYYGNLRMEKCRYKNYAGNEGPGCWEQIVGWDDEYRFATGLGCTFYNYGNMGYFIRESLVFYYLPMPILKEGWEVWGNQISSTCLTLGENNIQVKASVTELSISPNPVSTTAELSLSCSPGLSGYTVMLYDQIGKLVFRRKIETVRWELRRGSLPSGIYFLIVSDFSGTKMFRKKVILY